jgi:hypothetical protein
MGRATVSQLAGVRKSARPGAMAYPRSMRTGAAVALWILLALAGCATGQAPIPPAYTQDELRARCERHRGWWRPGGGREGFCEFDSQM